MVPYSDLGVLKFCRVSGVCVCVYACCVDQRVCWLCGAFLLSNYAAPYMCFAALGHRGNCCLDGFTNNCPVYFTFLRVVFCVEEWVSALPSFLL